MTTEEFIDYVEERTYPFTFLENGRAQLSELFRKYPESLLQECVDIGIKQYFRYENGKLTQKSVSEFLNKLGGIAYNKSRSPIDQELYHIKKCLQKDLSLLERESRRRYFEQVCTGSKKCSMVRYTDFR